VRLTIQAGGGPYGRVTWEAAEYVSSRPPQTAVMTTLYLTRTGGSQGHLRIYYQYVVNCPFSHTELLQWTFFLYLPTAYICWWLLRTSVSTWLYSQSGTAYQSFTTVSSKRAIMLLLLAYDWTYENFFSRNFDVQQNIARSGHS